MSRKTNGFVGTFSTSSDLEIKYPAVDHVGCSANVGTTEPFSKYWSDGVSWAGFNSTEINNTLRGGLVLAQRGAPASVTGTTAETLLCPAVIIPANSLGLNGMLRIESAWSSSATTNNRIYTIKIGTTTIFTRTRNSAVSISEVPLILIQNRGSLGSQISLTTANLGYGSNLSSVPATHTLDFSTDQSIYFYGQLGSAGDTLTLEAYHIRLETAA
jgi:hypothetical protein